MTGRGPCCPSLLPHHMHKAAPHHKRQVALKLAERARSRHGAAYKLQGSGAGRQAEMHASAAAERGACWAAELPGQRQRSSRLGSTRCTARDCQGHNSQAAPRSAHLVGQADRAQQSAGDGT